MSLKYASLLFRIVGLVLIAAAGYLQISSGVKTGLPEILLSGGFTAWLAAIVISLAEREFQKLRTEIDELKQLVKSQTDKSSGGKKVVAGDDDDEEESTGPVFTDN